MYLDLLLKRIKLLTFLIFQNETITPIFCSKVFKKRFIFSKRYFGDPTKSSKIQSSLILVNLIESLCKTFITKA